MGATFSRLKNWIAETLTYADLNAEIDNILNNLTPSGVDDYSTNTTQMRVTTDPGEVGTESLATSLAGEVERLRFAIKEIKGTDVAQWYSSSSYSLGSLGTAIGGGLPNNRLASGRTRSGASPASSQSIALVPHGTDRTVTLKGATTNFVYFIAGTQYTISTDVTLTSLTAAPSTNNTCLVNDAGCSDQEDTKYLGEYGSEITVDNMGTEISALIGKLAAFKLDNGSTSEYFVARVHSATQLTHIRRGQLFDSADAEFPRIVFSDNDTITLMKLAWIFAKTDGTLTVSYGNPRVSKDEPVTPASGDYWFDTVNNVWKIYNATTWDTAGATLVGYCMQTTSACIAARSFDYYKAHDDLNTLELEQYDNTEIRSRRRGDVIVVNGTGVKYDPDFVRWDIDTDLDTGAEAADTLYFLYVTESGESFISVTGPTFMPERRGLYHPSHTYRCVGQVHNNSSSNFEALISYHDLSERNFAVTAKVASSALTVKLHAPPHAVFKVKNGTITNPSYARASVLPGTQMVVSSGSTMGATSAVPHSLFVHGLLNAGRLELGLSQNPHLAFSLNTSTAEGGAGGADSEETLYSTAARTDAPTKVFGFLTSTQATAGTWATAPSAFTYGPIVATYKKSITGNGTFVAPTKFIKVLATGAGGGGGGGGGRNSTGAGGGAGGGGGGGGGQHGYANLEVTPGETLTIVIGTAGTAGTGGTSASNNATAGGDGSSTTLANASATLYTWYGGAGGGRGAGGNTSPTQGVAGNSSRFQAGGGVTTAGSGCGGGGGGGGGMPAYLGAGTGGNQPTAGTAGNFSGGGGGGGAAVSSAGSAGGNGGPSQFASGGTGGTVEAIGGADAGGGGGGGAAIGAGGAGGTVTNGAGSVSGSAGVKGGGGGGGSGSTNSPSTGGDGGAGGPGWMQFHIEGVVG